MNVFALSFLFINAIALLTLKRSWAPLPLLAGACYVTLNQGVEIGPLSFTYIRILIFIGFIRIIIRHERLTQGINGLDRLMILWSGWVLFSGIFHDSPTDTIVFRLGMIYNVCGIYFLIRVFCKSVEDIQALFRLIAVLFVPIAFEMIYENVMEQNLFAIMEGQSGIVGSRDGRIRAMGPFGHAILAGSVGAVCLPLMVGIWRLDRKYSVVGILACTVIIVTSGSSGPLLSAAAGIGAIFMWKFRDRMRLVRWTIVLGYIALDIVMNAPAYYIIARIKPLSSSTGYHRARLIQSAFSHFSEWWVVGTDLTRHWMAHGVEWSPDHADITNHYLKMGVIGGMPLMIIFILILVKAFSFIGKMLSKSEYKHHDANFMLWTIGAALFAHVVTCIGVSYFDQSFLFLYLTLGIIGSSMTAKNSDQ